VPADIALIIPARFGSTRFPGKALHKIAGKPLVQHVWERCCEARGIDAIIVATDDARIAEAARAFGAEVEMTSANHRSGTDRIAEVVRRRRNFKIIINVQGDEPLIDPKLITRIAREFGRDRRVQMVTAASRFGSGEDFANPHAVKVVTDRDENALYFSRCPIPFIRDGEAADVHLLHHGIYGFRRAFLLRFVRWRPGVLEQLEHLEQLRALENGARIRVLRAHTGGPGGVDTPQDALAIERLIRAAATP
jgi:3-deoxy-manno-octulosonate cytidylyltransferase (CMP-KDO synthetase)